MPILFLERIPLPSLRTYATFSVFTLSCALLYSYRLVGEFQRTDTKQIPLVVENGFTHNTFTKHKSVYDVLNVPKLDISSASDQPLDEQQVSEPPPFRGWNGSLPYDNNFFNTLYVISTEVWGVWTLVNTAYCCLIFIGKLIQMTVFGELRVIERQHLRDKFWNFVFYKFIFIFGVMNVQTMEEVVMWVAWFSTLGFYSLLTQLCKDRFEYVSSSPTTARWIHIKILSLLALILCSISGLLVVSVMVGYHAGYSILTFMAAECVLLGLKSMYVSIRYVIHLWDMNLEGIWENRAVYVYYSELVFELTSLCVDFGHHLHMLLWGNIFLSMASLVICMHLRYLMYEFQRRFRRHKNYLKVLRNVQSRFSMATPAELEQNSDNCAICWEKMETARKLPCSHLFHNSCLRSWLEQDTSCPTCRVSLSQPNTGAAGDAGADNVRPPPPQPSPPPRRRHMPFTNHFFHFDASRYVSWLPSFSVEVTHSALLNGTVQNTVQSSLLDNMAHQVSSIFPQTPINAVIEDLQVTQNVDVTIENILEGRVAPTTTESTEDFTPFNSETDETSTTTNAHTLPLPTTISSTGARALQAQLTRSMPLTSSGQGDIIHGNSNVAPDAMSAHQMSGETASVTGSRFSKSSSEREEMLRERKSGMIEAARRRFLSNSIQQQTETNTRQT